MSSIKDKAAIVGIGETEFSTNSGRSEAQLACEAIKKAVDDAGLSLSDIDGMVKMEMEAERIGEICNNLGIKNLDFFSILGCGGGGSAASILQAVMAIHSGVAKNVVCYRAMNGRSAGRFGQLAPSGAPAIPPYNVSAGMKIMAQFMNPWGMVAPVQQVAVSTRRHMHEFGTTGRQLGAIAVAFRKHACMNPRAMMYGKPITIEDYENSTVIADPLHVLDCCLETDGAAAVIVTSAERARDLKQRPVYIMAAAQALGPRFAPLAHYTRNMVEYPECQRVGKVLFGTAGVTPKDIDVAEIYDAFTTVVLLALEDYGFCKKGEGGPFVEGGRIELGGELPVNTSGGQLSEGYIHGMNIIVEGVRQMRGTSTAQVKNAELALVAGAPPIGNSGIIIRR